jgi:drug/metabolite transporter (DMT)-like permease
MSGKGVEFFREVSSANNDKTNLGEVANLMSTDQNNKNRYHAVVLMIGAALLWSLGGVLIKWISWNPLAISGMRSAIAAMVMLAYRRRFRFNWSFAQIGGAIAYAATVTLFVLANKMTSAANAILLQYTAPIYVAALSAWFLGERVNGLDWLTILASIGGMGLFFLDNLTTGGQWGNILAILSAVSFAGMVLFTRKQKDGSPLESLFLGNILSVVIALPFMFQSGPGLSGWAGLVLLGVFQLGFSYILYAEAIKHITALEGILIPIIEPVLNPIWVFLLLGERPGRWAIVGGTIVLASVTFRCVTVTLRVRSQSQTRE